MKKPKIKSAIYSIFGLILCGIFIIFVGILIENKNRSNKTTLVKPKIEQNTLLTKDNQIASENTIKLKDMDQVKEKFTFYKTLSDEDKPIKKESKDIESITKKDESKKYEKGFTVQVGSFKKESEAWALRSKLKEKGYDVYVVNFNDSKGNLWYRVRIGSYNSKHEAYNLVEKIKKDEGLQAFLTKKSK